MKGNTESVRDSSSGGGYSLPARGIFQAQLNTLPFGLLPPGKDCSLGQERTPYHPSRTAPCQPAVFLGRIFHRSVSPVLRYLR